MTEAAKRGEMPKGTNTVLDRRTIHNANKNLLDIVKSGHSVLDVGCGSGSITVGIGELTGENGMVTGIDTSEHLIELAKNNFSHIGHVSFEVADINTYQPESRYDVITTARVLQWVDNPVAIIAKMQELLKEDGCLTILDYNHEKIEWTPRVPESMQQFYHAFLQWRADAGMDNGIADHLDQMLQQVGFRSVTVSDFSEKSIKGDPTFYDDLHIWAKVAATRGHQLVQDGYITEGLRTAAIADYERWMEEDASSMTLYLLAVTATK